MKVFISYSGTKSQKTADAASRFLSQLLPEIRFLHSGSDIALGSRWRDVADIAFSDIDVVLVCVTRDNLDKPWLLYEIGAASASGADVIPFLLDVQPSELSGPMAMLQAVTADKSGVWRLVQSLYSLLEAKSPLSEEQQHGFEKTWPAFAANLDAIRQTPSMSSVNVIAAIGDTEIITVAGHGDLHAPDMTATRDYDKSLSGDVVAHEKLGKEPRVALSAEQAFERINAAVRQNLQQLKENVEQARAQSRHFFKLTIGFASAGFLVVLGAVLLLLAGEIPAGIVTSVMSLIPEATAGLFFKKDSELRKSIETYNQHILNSQQTLTMIDLCETMVERPERDRVKRDIIFRVLDISDDPGLGV